MLLFVGFTSCDDDDSGDGGPLVGSGNVVTESRSLSNFNQVNASGEILDVNITAGVTFRVEVEADDNVVDRVETRVDGDVLTINPQIGPTYDSNLNMTVNVTLPLLRAVRGDNAVTIDFTGFQDDTNEIRIEGSNSTVITGDNTNTSGLVIDLNNSSQALLFDVNAPEAAVTIANTSRAEVAVTDRITGTVVNTSTLRYRNDPDVSAVTTASGGTIEDAN